MSACAYGDETCPCADGDPCHYRPTATTKAWKPPRNWWRPVPCGHPPEPLAWMGPDGPVCHCGWMLAFAPVRGYAPGVNYGVCPLVGCDHCGCLVALPLVTA